MTGYAMPAKFQKIGLVGESENWKLDTSVDRTISEVRESQGEEGGNALDSEHTRLTHLELRELETTAGGRK